MDLGAFSISLAVKDIKASRNFYTKLGFTDFAGDISQNWLIMKNGRHLVGLFQGMFDQNILTFNPGWDQDGQALKSFMDVRDIQQHLKEQGVSFEQKADDQTEGPAHFVIKDPDGNIIMLDQHIPKT